MPRHTRATSHTANALHSTPPPVTREHARERTLHCLLPPLPRAWADGSNGRLASASHTLRAMGKKGAAATRASCSRAAAAAASCWGRFGLGLAALWRRLRWIGLPRRRLRTYVLSSSGLNYGPLGYSQNFEDLDDGECEPNFSVRFARHAGATRPHAPSVAS